LPEPKQREKTTEYVDPEALFSFLYPPGQYHSKSTARLYVFAEFGPILVKGRLCGGYKGQHLVTDQELDDMIKEMIREDILKVYVENQVLTRREQEEVIQQADSKFKQVPNYTRSQVEELLKTCGRGDEGEYLFHDLQRIVREDREKKLRERQKMYPDVKKKTLPPGTFAHFKQDIKTKKIPDQELFIHTAKMLSRNSCKIAEVQDRNDPGLVQNTRFLRDDFSFYRDNPSLPRWHQYAACKGKGTYVKPHLPWKSKYAGGGGSGGD